MFEDWSDKTQPPTPHKRQEARRAGNIPRSDDLAAAATCLALMLLLRQTGGGLLTGMKSIMSESLRGSVPSLARLAWLLAMTSIPLLLGLMLVSMLSNLFQTRFFIGFRKPSGALDPARAIAQIFSGRSIVQVGFSLMKLSSVVAIFMLVAPAHFEDLTSLMIKPASQMLSSAGDLAFAIGIRVSAALLALGVLDYAWQRYRHERELRMSHRELKEELRRQEGDPSRKHRQRGRDAGGIMPIQGRAF